MFKKQKETDANTKFGDTQGLKKGLDRGLGNKINYERVSLLDDNQMFANLKKQEELDYSEESQEGSPEGWRSQSSEGKIERHHRPILISDVE